MNHKLQSTAVMNRRVEPDDGADDFPTPPWATRALCEEVFDLNRTLYSVYEPAAGRGFMSRTLKEYFDEVHVADKFEYPNRVYPIEDYLTTLAVPKVDWVITNPPFKHAEEFVLRSLMHAPNVAILCRANFAESVGRYKRLFEPHPPTIIAQFVERVPMVKGRCDPKATTATAYAWFVWHKPRTIWDRTEFRWIPPCRAALEQPGDYDL